MAYINGNKPIVTNGLVYALDFGNTKSYVSGSNRAVSLAYDPLNTTVTQSVPTQTAFIPLPQVGNGTLEFNFGGITTALGTTYQPNYPPPQYIQRTSSLSTIDINNDFTITTVIQPKSTGTFLSQQTSTSNFYIKLTTTSSLVGYYYNNRFYNREFKGITTSSLQHLTYRYSSGSIDMFINGIPVTASSQDSITTNWHGSGSLFINGISGYPNPSYGNYDMGFLRVGMLSGHPYSYISGSLGNLYVYNRKLTSDEIYQNYIISATRYRLSTAPKPYTLDENVYQYVQSTGITDSNTQTALSTFVSGLKLNKIWDKMLAIYPFLSSTTASHSYNLKEPGLNRLLYSGSWTGSLSGSYPGTSTSFVSLPSILPTTMYPGFESGSAHLTYLSYDLPQSSSYLVGATNTPSGSGGLITFSGSRTIHTFTASDSFSMFAPGNVEVLVVAAGGGGGYMGGGGAGGVLYSASFFVSSGSYAVTVGTGSITSSGQNSVFSSLTAIGGGKGGQVTYEAGFPGGSGGGAGLQAGGGGSNIYIGGSGSLGQGNMGSAYINENAQYTGGAGGGAGTPGKRNITPSGQASVPSGGDGLQYSISGTPTYYGGGGGASQASAFSGSGGIGGGGSGSTGISQDGQPNTGGGGGGSGVYTGYVGGGAGGSGIVIISYPTAPTSSFALKITETSLTGSLNSPETSAITASGNIGLVTVSRKQAGILSLHKNTVSASFGTAGSFLPFPNLYLNAANNAGTASGITPSTIAFASVGAGLTTSEVATYHNLIGQLQANLKRQNTLLDNYSGAAAAYSLRRIGPSSYFGPAIRVRRDSDNTLRDIGFTSDGQLDTVGLLDFVGVTGSGFVTTWYDQSGNGNNAAQTITGSQPLAIRSGSIPLFQNKPTVYFYSTASSIFSSFTSQAPNDVFILYNKIGTTTGANQLIYDGINADTMLYRNEGGGSQIIMFGGGDALYSSIAFNTPYLSNVLWGTTGQSKYLYLNGTFQSSGSGAAVSRGGVSLGNYTNGTQGLNGYIPEFLMYSSSQTTNRTAIESNLNNYYKVYGSVTSSYDADYSAFITATGITQPTQSAALETLVSDLKSYGLWNKMKAIYPMITDKNNRFAYSQELNTEWNPVSSSVTTNATTAPDGTTTAELILGSTPSPTTFTVINNGASAYTINGSDNPTLTLEKGRTYNFDINASGHPFYIMTGSGAYTAGGQYNTGVTGQGTQSGTLTFVVPENAPSTLAYVCQVHPAMGGTINVIENTDEHYIYQTIADGLVTGSEYVASIHSRFYNQQYIAIDTNVGSTAWFDIKNGLTGSFTGSRATITSIGSGWYRCALYFTSSVASGPQNIQFHLANADNDFTFAGTGTSGSYLWGAQFENGNVLGPYRATTTVGFTTGSMLDQMKFNLRNSVDTDAGFRITFSGSWNGGYSGLRGDGANGTYAATKVNSTVRDLAMNSGSFSVYSRSNTVGSFGLSNNSNVTNTRFGWDGGTFRGEYGGSYGGVGTLTGTPGNIRGLMTVNRNLNRTTGFVRTQKYIDYTYGNPDGTITSNDITAGAAGFAFGYYYDATGYGLANPYSTNTWEYAFSHFAGVPLTDYESKALYWIVQKYQTTLGRQVY